MTGSLQLFRVPYVKRLARCPTCINVIECGDEARFACVKVLMCLRVLEPFLNAACSTQSISRLSREDRCGIGFESTTTTVGDLLSSDSHDLT